MTFAEYQVGVMRTYSGINSENYGTLVNAAMGLAGESGEVADIMKKVKFQGHELDRQKLIGELGDVLYYVALAANALDTDLESIARCNHDKLAKRYPNGFEVERSVHREGE